MKPNTPAVTVYEIVNPKRKELFVGRTTLPMNTLIAHHRQATLPLLKAWASGDGVEYRALELGLTPSAAVEFARGYVTSFRRDGWRVISDETA